MTYDIPAVTNYQSFFTGVNTLVGNNLPIMGTLVIIFIVSLVASSGSVKRFEVQLVFASWITMISGWFMVVLFHIDASIAIIPTLLAVLSVLLMESTKSY